MPVLAWRHLMSVHQCNQTTQRGLRNQRSVPKSRYRQHCHILALVPDGCHGVNVGEIMRPWISCTSIESLIFNSNLSKSFYVALGFFDSMKMKTLRSVSWSRHPRQYQVDEMENRDACFKMLIHILSPCDRLSLQPHLISDLNAHSLPSLGKEF